MNAHAIDGKKNREKEAEWGFGNEERLRSTITLCNSTALSRLTLTMADSIATEIKRKRPPTFQHYPVDRGKPIKLLSLTLPVILRRNSEEVEKSLGGKDQDQVEMEGSEKERRPCCQLKIGFTCLR